MDQVANQVWRSVHGAPPPLIQGDDERDLWKEVIDGHGLPFGDRFVADEWRQVILGNGITGLAGYQAASRAGRGKPLTAPQRARVWAAVEAFEARLRERGVLTHALVCAEATRLLEQGAVGQPQPQLCLGQQLLMFGVPARSSTRMRTTARAARRRRAPPSRRSGGHVSG
nr:hypothetical protein [Pseudofrankia sp. DC12]